MPPRVLSQEQFQTLSRFEEVLSTDSIFTGEHIAWAKRQLCKYQLSNLQLAWILLLLNLYSTTGKNAYTFRKNLREALQNGNKKLLHSLFSQSDALPEITKNPYLSEEERNKVTSVIQREYRAMINALQLYDTQLPFVKNDLEEIIYDEKKNGYVASSIFAGCYARLCYDEDIVASAFSPEKIQILDYTKNGLTHMYEFSREELLPILEEKNPVNPRTGENFSSSILKKLRQRFLIESKILRYAKEIE